MKDFIKAFSVVVVSAIVGYEVGIRQWENRETEKVVSQVVYLNNQLKDVQRWVNEVGVTLPPEAFARGLKDRMAIVDLLSRRI